MADGFYTLVVMLLFVATNDGSVHAISCQDAIARMLPCQGFLMGFTGMSVRCCQSAQSLSQIAKSNPPELTTVCQCFKQAITIIGFNGAARAQQIPQLCHIDLDTALINPNVDCNKMLNAPTQSPPPSSSPSPSPSTSPSPSPSLCISI